MTEDEETALVNAILFIQDLGLPPHLEEDNAFHSLFEKITEPSHFDYSLAHFTTNQFLRVFMRMSSKRQPTQATSR